MKFDLLELANVEHVAAADVVHQPVLEKVDGGVNNGLSAGGGNGVTNELVVDRLVGPAVVELLGLEEVLLSLEVELHEAQEVVQLGGVTAVVVQVVDQGEELLVLLVELVVLDVEGGAPLEGGRDGGHFCCGGFALVFCVYFREEGNDEGKRTEGRAPNKRHTQ